MNTIIVNIPIQASKSSLPELVCPSIAILCRKYLYFWSSTRWKTPVIPNRSLLLSENSVRETEWENDGAPNIFLAQF